MNRRLLTQKIKDLATEKGANIVGIADLKLLKGIFTYPKNLLDRYKYGVSVAVNLEQYGHYDNTTEEKAFAYLEKIARYVEEYIRSQGFKSKIIPCDKRVRREGTLYWKGAISHKAVAKTAGLGWIGKSTLLVTPNFGPRVCLITILTDIPLVPNRPKKNKCSTCKECINSCPINALVEIKFDYHPNKLEETFDVSKCGPYIEKTWDMQNICWSCLLACPYGKTKGERANSAVSFGNLAPPSARSLNSGHTATLRSAQIASFGCNFVCPQPLGEMSIWGNVYCSSRYSICFWGVPPTPLR